MASPRIRAARHRDQMHVVRHQAVAEYRNTFDFAALPRKLEIPPPAAAACGGKTRQRQASECSNYSPSP